MNRQDRKPRAIAIAKTREAETASLKALALISLGAVAALAVLMIGFAG